MNRYTAGGPSKASATTLCQKCLKRGHFSYECTASQQDRPYVSRPSRTQQLQNPKLAPKIIEPVSRPAQPKPGSNVKAPPDQEIPRKRSRSASSTSSSDSVSTISTNQSRSRSPSPRKRSKEESKSNYDHATANHSTGNRGRQRGSSRNRRRRDQQSRSVSSVDRSRHMRSERGRRDPSRSRSPRNTHDNKAASRTSRSRSPYRDKDDDKKPGRGVERRSNGNIGSKTDDQLRKRSSSPYSKRLALTRSTDNGA